MTDHNEFEQTRLIEDIKGFWEVITGIAKHFYIQLQSDLKLIEKVIYGDDLSIDPPRGWNPHDGFGMSLDEFEEWKTKEAKKQERYLKRDFDRIMVYLQKIFGEIQPLTTEEHNKLIGLYQKFLKINDNQTLNKDQLLYEQTSLLDDFDRFWPRLVSIASFFDIALDGSKYNLLKKEILGQQPVCPELNLSGTSIQVERDRQIADDIESQYEKELDLHREAKKLFFAVVIKAKKYFENTIDDTPLSQDRTVAADSENPDDVSVNVTPPQLSPRKRPSARREWSENNSDFITNSEAVEISGSKLTLSKLSRLLKPDGKIRYMRKSRRSKVHAGDFLNYLKQEYPSNHSNEAKEFMAGIEARAKQVRCERK